jgi:molecular chaperone HtpG
MPQKIEIPNFLLEKLADARFDYVALQAVKDFQEWFTDSKMPFFPDYTDHGINHLQDVLSTAANLIPIHSQEYFTSADATVLIMAVLFHDSALHLSEEGFFELIQGDYSKNFINTFDKQTWRQTWQEYLFNARRWDENKLIDVFGSTKTGEPLAQVRDPFSDWNNLTKHDYRFIGEFIRQHHPRIAHEMVMFGVPGNSSIAFSVNPELPKAWRDLIGLVARSHGLPLRTCVDYLGTNPTWGVDAKHEYQGIHAVYLMALLRIADYVQIQANRSSELTFFYKKVPSRVSILEHKVHKSIINITNRTLDPESLRIDANPEEVAVFLRLKEWLSGIQYELDASWAVFGEVYGRLDGLKNLGLMFRRIRSNLDNVQAFAETVGYVPERIHFEASRAELLPLLLSPLYGDDPTYGVRELVQNSVDAVQELEQFIKDNPNYNSAIRYAQEADVIVHLSKIDDDGLAVMTISDRGIGMTEETIRNFFLKAGASYRRSNYWRNNFELNDSEGNNNSKIIRSGRFGVGGLATFLIGKEIEVQTRHITAQEGYSFKTTLDTRLIEMNRHFNLPIGTCIKIKIDSIGYEKLLKNTYFNDRPNYWDWYRFDFPKVLRQYTDLQEEEHHSYAEYFINPLSLNGTWRKLNSTLPYDIYWTFDKAPALTCNGLFISDDPQIKRFPNEILERGDGIILDLVKLPNIAIIDCNGTAPINLKRSSYTTPHVPFGAEIIEDFLTEMLAWLFFNGPTSVNNPESSKIRFNHWLSEPASNSFIANSKGYAIKLAILLQHLELRHSISAIAGMELKIINDDTYLSIGGKGSPNGSGSFVNINIINPSGKSEIPGYNTNATHKYNRRILYSFSHERPEETKGISFPTENIETKEDFIFAPFGGQKFTLSSLGNSLSDSSLPIQEKQEGPWLFQINKSACPTPGFEIIKFPDIPNRGEWKLVDQLSILNEYFYPEGTYIKATSQPWLLDRLWKKYFGLKWIPYAIQDRVNMFPETAKTFARKYPHLLSAEFQEIL